LNIPVEGMKIPVSGDPMVIVLKPELVVTIGIDGQVHAGVEIGGEYTNTVNATATWKKEKGDWEYSKISNPQFTFKPPAFKTEAYAKVFTRPRLQLMLFGKVGPYVQIEGYYRLDADPQDNPWWTLRVGLDGEMGIRFEFELLGFIKSVPFKEPITFYDEIIRQAPVESPPAEEPPTEEPAPSDGNVPPPPGDSNPPGGNEGSQGGESNPPDTSPPAGTGNENIQIVFNNTSAYVINRSQSSVRVKGLVFNRIDSQGNITASYQADTWGNFYSGYSPVQPGYCLRIALPNSATAPDCTVAVNYETSQEGFHFWRQTSSSSQFRVLQNGNLLQTCEISAGSCWVNIP